MLDRQVGSPCAAPHFSQASNSADLVHTGFAKSLGRPGGDITGLSAMSPETGTKLLDFLLVIIAATAPAHRQWQAELHRGRRSDVVLAARRRFAQAGGVVY